MPKWLDQADLIGAIKLAAHSQSILDPALMKRVVTRRHTSAREPSSGLTLPEQRVAGLIAKGHTNKEIAEELGLSSNTVRNYVGRVFGKLHIHVAPKWRGFCPDRSPEMIVERLLPEQNSLSSL